MGPRKYPPLKPREIVEILKRRGFVEIQHQRGGTDHKFFTRVLNGKQHLPQVDMGVDEVSEYWLKLTIQESGLSIEDFYCSTKTAAGKIGKRCVSDKELRAWELSVA